MGGKQFSAAQSADEAREEQALEQMISWANEFTPWELWLWDLRAQVRGAPVGTEVFWSVRADNLRAWGEAKDWSKGIKEIVPA